MITTQIVIWVGMAAGVALIILVIYIVPKRDSKFIKVTDLGMVALAAALILGSQYSKIIVGNLLTLEKEVSQLRKTVSSSQEQIKLLQTSQVPKEDIINLIKKVNALDTNIERNQAQIKHIQAAVSYYQKLLGPGKFPYEKNMPQKTYDEPFEKSPAPPEIYQPKKQPEIFLQPKPETAPQPTPEIPPKKK